MGATMRAGILAATVAVSLLGAGTAWSQCVPSKSRACVNFNAVSQISQQIGASEPVAPPPKPAPVADPKTPYTGPTVGLVPNERRAPEVGYRWAIN
jgi:hypothetical protein